MKNYKLLKDLPIMKAWLTFNYKKPWPESFLWEWYLVEWDLEGYNIWDRIGWTTYNTFLNICLKEKRLEEVNKDYIVTEEGEIIGEYEWDCWYLNEERNTCYTSCVSGSEVDHFITKEQCDRREIKESALRKLWELYYENWYEENKGDYEIYYSVEYSVFVPGNDVCNTSLPHCKKVFQENMIKIPEIKALYLTYFWLDGK